MGFFHGLRWIGSCLSLPRSPLHINIKRESSCAIRRQFRWSHNSWSPPPTQNVMQRVGGIGTAPLPEWAAKKAGSDCSNFRLWRALCCWHQLSTPSCPPLVLGPDCSGSREKCQTGQEFKKKYGAYQLLRLTVAIKPQKINRYWLSNN